MATKEKDTETIRSKQHRALDEIYSARDPEVEGEVFSTEEPEGKAKRKSVTLSAVDGLKANGEVKLDREGWLAVAKHASRIAQSVA